MDTNINTAEPTAPIANKKGKAGKIFNIVWQVFKGLFIAACILALIFNTFVSIHYYKEDMNVTELHVSVPYPLTTQDYADLMEEYNKNPEGTKWKEMRRAFYAKYSIKYQDTATYSELEWLHKEKPDSEEYNQKLQELMDEFGITAEEIIFYE